MVSSCRIGRTTVADRAPPAIRTVRNAVLNRRTDRDTDAVPSIVGRAAELAEIDRALDDARASRGRLLLLREPAGIGKTRLIEAALDRAAELGLRSATGYAIDDPGAPPLWPWLRAMQDWPGAETLPTAEVSDADPQARFRLFLAVAGLIRARAAADSGLRRMDSGYGREMRTGAGTR
jgi:AAA ATPase-like protein